MTVVASKYAPKKNSLYETEAWAVEALLRHFPVVGEAVWEPAAGNHRIADVLTLHGADVTTSDIATYRRRHTFEADFLAMTSAPVGIRRIYTNPPYGRQNTMAVKFIEKALELCDGVVAMLLTGKFDFGNTRTHLFRDNPRFVAKIHLIDRISWENNGRTGTEDHAWAVWGPMPALRQKPISLYEGRIAR